MPAELLQIRNALIDLLQVLMNQPVSQISPLGAAGIERAEKRPDFRKSDIKIAAVTDEVEAVDVNRAVLTVIIGLPDRRRKKSDFFVVANGFRSIAGELREISNAHSSCLWHRPSGDARELNDWARIVRPPYRDGGSFWPDCLVVFCRRGKRRLTL